MAGSRLKKYHPRGGTILQEVLQRDEPQAPEQYTTPTTRSSTREEGGEDEEVRRGLHPAVRRLQAIVIPSR